MTGKDSNEQWYIGYVDRLDMDAADSSMGITCTDKRLLDKFYVRRSARAVCPYFSITNHFLPTIHALSAYEEEDNFVSLPPRKVDYSWPKLEKQVREAGFVLLRLTRHLDVETLDELFEEETAGVYALWFPDEYVEGFSHRYRLCYVGMSTDLHRRLLEHLCSRGLNRNYRLRDEQDRYPNRVQFSWVVMSDESFNNKSLNDSLKIDLVHPNPNIKLIKQRLIWDWQPSCNLEHGRPPRLNSHSHV